MQDEMATGIDKDGNFMELKLVPHSYPNVKKVLDK